MDYSPLALVLSLVGVLVGLMVFINPALVIRFQIKFYEKINWRMEPISLPKELRNTKAMGLFLTLVCLLAIVYIKLILK